MALGRQARVPLHGSEMQLAQDVARLMESGDYAAALNAIRLGRQNAAGADVGVGVGVDDTASAHPPSGPSKVRGMRVRGVDVSPQVAQLHGDIIMAMVDRHGEGTAGAVDSMPGETTTALCLEAVDAYGDMLGAAGQGDNAVGTFPCL